MTKKSGNIDFMGHDGSYREVFNAVGDMIAIQNIDDGTIYDINDATLERTGYSREEFIENGIQLTNPNTPEYSTEKMLEHIGVAFKEGFHIFNWGFIEKSGKFHPTEVRLKVAEIEGRDRLIAVVRDVTDRVKTEDELAHYHESLENIVESLTKEIEELKARQDETDKLAAIGKCVGGISHEIKNPLSTMAMAIYNLKRQIGEDSSYSKRLNVIDLKIRRCVDIVESVANLTRHGEANLTNISCNDLLSDIPEIIDIPDNIDFKLHEFDEDVMVSADKCQFDMLITNISNNAIQAMPGGGELSIRCLKEGSNVVIAISDTGIGISEEHRDRIFDPLFTTKKQGMGFGLMTAKLIVEKHDGTISVDSEPGKGSTFTITLPRLS